jgi:peptidoglycan/LPS O-acetylase OafA/YrhL
LLAQLEADIQDDSLLLLQRRARRVNSTVSHRVAAEGILMTHAQSASMIGQKAIDVTRAKNTTANSTGWSQSVAFANNGLLMILVLLLLLSFVCTTREVVHAGLHPRAPASWTGLQFFLGTCIFLEHAGVDPISGSSGIGAFFVLSGAALSLTDKQGTHTSYLDFLVKRLVRIVPVYWVFLALALASGLPTSDNAAGYPAPAAGTLWNPLWQLIKMPYLHPVRFFLLSCWTSHQGPAWFVSTLAFLYLIYPILARLYAFSGTHKSVVNALFVLFAAYGVQWCICLLIWATPAVPNHACISFPRNLLGWITLILQNPLFRLPEFIMGSMTTHTILALKANQAWKDRWDGALAICTDGVSLLIVIVGVISVVTDVFRFDKTSTKRAQCENPMWITSRMDVLSILWAFLLFGLGFGAIPSYTRQILQSRLALGVGNLWLGMYLWSTYILIPFGCYNEDGSRSVCSAFTLFIGYCVTLICAILSYYCLEEPVSSFVKRWLPSAQQQEQRDAVFAVDGSRKMPG